MDAGDWTEFRRALTAYVGRRVSSPEDAEDIVQEVLLRLHRQEAAQSPGNPAAWLHRVARNAVIDHYRVRRPPSVELQEELAAPEGAEEPGEGAAACLRPLLASLPPTYAEAVRLADLEGRSGIEVARALGLTLPAAKSRVRRGRALLRGLLESCCRVEWDGRGNVLDTRRVGPGPDCKL